MPDYQFERESRTPFSESFIVEDEGEQVGHVDIHFTPAGIVQATLCVPAGFDEDAIEELIAEIDERLVLTADQYREDFVVTVWRGERVGIYSEDDEEADDEDDEDEHTNGALPHA